MCRLMYCGVFVVLIGVNFGSALFIDSSTEEIGRGSRWNKTTTGNDEVRCYCNMPACVSTGYMCKSRVCFSNLAEVTSASSVQLATHGCLDLLDASHQNWCRNLPNEGVVYSPQSASKSLLLCCTQDMCNHVDSPENHVELNSPVLNGSERLGSEREREKERSKQPIPISYGYTNAEVWFRAATIAVPICGALILFVLIALAIKLLRSDANDERAMATKLRPKDGTSFLLSPRHFHNCTDAGHDDNSALSKKVPLLFKYEKHVTGSIAVSQPGQKVNVLRPVYNMRSSTVEKNEANAKLNNVHNVGFQTLPSDSVQAPSNIALNVQPLAPSNVENVQTPPLNFALLNGVQNVAAPVNGVPSPLNSVENDAPPSYAYSLTPIDLEACSGNTGTLYDLQKLNNLSSNNNNINHVSCNNNEHSCNINDHASPTDQLLSSAVEVDECKLRYKKAFLMPFNSAPRNQ